VHLAGEGRSAALLQELPHHAKGNAVAISHFGSSALLMVVRSQDIARARRAWRRRQTTWDPAKLIFLDESRAKTNLTRLRGVALNGASESMPAVPRAIGKPPP
jgi:hypothetical protein